MTIKADMNLKELDKSVMAFGGKLNMTIDPSLANSGDTSISQDINYYFTNGTYYMDMGAQGKYKMAMSFDDVLNGVVIDFIRLFMETGDPFAMFRKFI